MSEAGGSPAAQDRAGWRPLRGRVRRRSDRYGAFLILLIIDVVPDFRR
jgi:hypothetical protein